MADIVLVLWIVCGVLAAVIAGGKGRSAIGWLVIGALTGILGPIIVSLLPPIGQPASDDLSPID